MTALRDEVLEDFGMFSVGVRSPEQACYISLVGCDVEGRRQWGETARKESAV